MSAHSGASPISDRLPSIPSDITFTPIQAAPFVNYIERLDAAHDRISTFAEQLCPPSRTPSPVPEPRSEILRTRLKDAMKYANFNPMSSKWNKVSGLLRTTAKSRRYCTVGEGVRMGEKVEVDVGRYKFVLPSTDEEWKQCEDKWEKRFEKSPTPQGRTSKFWPSVDEEPRPPSKAELVRDKVKAWQAKVVPAAPAAPASSEEVSEADLPGSSKGKGKEVETKQQAPLPFAVVKRNAVATLADKPAETTGVSGKLPAERSAPRRSPDHLAQDMPRSPRRIADLSEMYIPPSFPQQLVTSTPGILGKGVTVPQRVKPPPILPRQYASSPSSSPRLPNQSLERIVPPLASSSSLPPVTPSPHRMPKRSRPITPPSESSPYVAQTKKARTLPESEAFSNPPPPPTTPPVPTSPPRTPPRAAALDKGLGNANGLPVPTTPDNRGALPTLTELLASSRRSRPRPRPPSRKQKSAATTPAPEGRGAQGALAPADELPAINEEREASPAPSRARTMLSSPASGSSDSPQSVRVRPRSPVSPLFAKPGDSFMPPFVSTQAAGPTGGGFGGIAASQPPVPGTLTRGSSGAFGMGYNSQFDVEGQVGMVSDLLEKDVDFDGWLRDIPEVEAET
ncbi:hypothetical protein PHLGIDRAFT_130181 [Phlebiopsis gigantea 11061_1 CR5-6]|uniref:Uncharacterized protein n=1 Tax=Phlebiopsis gigantea (strain 11061_1 CR5-6) TaxID=745531 RepID=A0A0C3RSK1_PHLG1|nr:hypothetical protein PHLGIDRAFT_130181 [Phlebiopsis gigantea 11061_1 CR5-6]